MTKARAAFHIVAAFAMVFTGWAISQVSELWAVRIPLCILAVVLYIAADLKFDLLAKSGEGE